MMPRPATPFYYGWVIVTFTGAMQIFSIGLLFYGIGVALLPWMDTFKTGRTALAAVPFACTIAISIASPFAGALFDRFPSQRLIAWSLVALGTGLLAISLAQSVIQLIAIHATLLTGGAIGGGAFAAQTLTAKWFGRRRGLALALTASGSGVGGLIMPYLMALGIAAYGWRLTYGAIGAFVIAVLVPLAVLLVRDAPAMLDPIERTMPAADAPAPARESPAPVGTGDILRSPVFLVTSLGIGSLLAVQVILQFYLPSMGSALGSSPARSALLVSILAGAALCSKPVWGYFIDRSDPRTIYFSLAVIYGYMLVVLAGWTAPLTYTRLVIGAITCGFAAGALQALMGTVLARTFGRHNFGRVLGLGHMVMNVSCFAPIFSAYVYERTGTYALTSAVLLTALIVMLALFLRVVAPGTGRAEALAQ
ncbi:MAG TPA: MFS transporter [Novosphingobium sp.]|nr:MFS transporter [Novosphingobium sp.]